MKKVEIIKKYGVAYQGLMQDRMTGNTLGATRYYSTWEQAQHATERLDKKYGYGDRSAIKIIEED